MHNELLEKIRSDEIPVLLKQIIDAKKHDILFNVYVIEKINCVVAKLMFDKKDIVKLIKSCDDETFCLGAQLLFEDYLDQYNQLCENDMWEMLIHRLIKNYRWYVNE